MPGGQAEAAASAHVIGGAEELTRCPWPDATAATPNEPLAELSEDESDTELEPLDTLRMPVTVLFGDRDWMFNPLVPSVIRKMGRDPFLRIVPDSGHQIHIENPAAFNAIIESVSAR